VKHHLSRSSRVSRSIQHKKAKVCPGAGSLDKQPKETNVAFSLSFYSYRYHPPTPAKELLAEFWKLETGKRSRKDARRPGKISSLFNIKKNAIFDVKQGIMRR
jgi:hypothetical protein